MADKTLSALTTLAAKLGTTSEYLWGVLLKQAPISGVTDLLVCAAWVAGAVAWAKFVKRKTARDEHSRADWEDEAAVTFAWASVGLLAITVAVIVGVEFSLIVAALLNPEYWALCQILK